MCVCVYMNCNICLLLLKTVVPKRKRGNQGPLAEQARHGKKIAHCESLTRYFCYLWLKADGSSHQGLKKERLKQPDT